MKHLRTGGLAGLSLRLELKNRSDLGEAWVWSQHGDEGDLFLKLLAEPDKESVDEGTVIDGITKLPKFITDGLDALAENGDGGIALSAGAELDVEGVDA